MITSVILIALLCLLLNIPFGSLRVRQRKFSLLWFVYIHVPVPLVVLIRVLLKIDPLYIPLFVIMSIIGQYLGAKMSRKTS